MGNLLNVLTLLPELIKFAKEFVVYMEGKFGPDWEAKIKESRIAFQELNNAKDDNAKKAALDKISTIVSSL